MRKGNFYPQLFERKNPLVEKGGRFNKAFIVKIFLAIVFILAGKPAVSFAIPGITFINGTSQSFTVCENSGAYDISSMLTVSDVTAGQTLSWSLASGPANGSATATYSVTSTAGNNIPVGLTYTPATGFSGTDNFSVMATNGTQTITATISVTVNLLPAITLGTIPAICQGVTSTTLSYSNPIVFDYTGGAQTWTVPSGVTAINFDVDGASGGHRYGGAGTPGNGGRVVGTLSVTPGEVLNIFVGGSGGTGSTSGAAGGYNGGGQSYNYGGSGGGASDIRVGGTALANRIIVAGGGGGGAADGSSINGGDGGGLAGAGGGPNPNNGTTPAGGGTQILGGTGANYPGWGTGSAGGPGTGGDGLNDPGVTYSAGGGAGFYGGGGGVWSGGGGGSSYTDPTLVTSFTHTQGYRNGDGIVTITYPYPSTTTYSIAWNSGATGAGFTNVSGAAIPATPLMIAIPAGAAAGAYTGTFTINDGSCTSNAQTITVTINPLPTSTGATNSGAICMGATATLDANSSNADTWSWTGTDGSSSDAQNPVMSPTATTTYSVTLSNSITGCSQPTPYTTTVTVNPLPSSSGPTSSSATICDGGTVSLNDHSINATNWTWAGSDGSSSTLQHPVMSPTTTTTYSLTLTNTITGCSQPVVYTTTVSVNPLPSSTGATNNGPICNNGSTVTLYDHSTGANTWSWMGSDGSSSTLQNPVMSPTATTTYSLTLSNSVTGCSQPTIYTTTATVYQLPTITPVSNQAVCNGVATVADTFKSSIGGTTYTWTNSNAAIGLAASGDTDIIASFIAMNNGVTADTGTIIVTPSANGCAGAPDTFMIKVYPTPMLTGSLIRSAICDNTVFSYGDTSLTAGTTFAWTMPSVSGISAPATSGVDSINEVLSNSTTAQAMVTFVYTLTANGCVTTENVIVTVNPNPQLNSATSNVQCDSQVFSYAPSSLTNDSSFAWIRLYVEGIDSLSGSGTGAINDLLINTTSGNVTDTYKYIITAYGCSDTELVTVLVHPTPMLSSATSSLAVCSGQAFNYLPESLTGSAVSYSWIRDSVGGITPALGSGMGAINETLVNFTSSPQTVPYSYTLLAYGCTNTETIYLTVNPLPVAPAITTYVSSVCSNAQNQNFGVAMPPPGYETYYWSSPNATVQQGATGQFSIVNFTEPGTATVVLTVTVDSTQCYSSSSLNVIVGGSTADQPYVVYSAGEFVCLENNVTSYQWGYDSKATLDSTILAGQINQNYANSNPDTVHNYYWVITSQNGCFMKSYYNGPVTTAISNVNDVTDVTVYPNPTSSFINVDIHSTVAGDVTIELSNMLGQKMKAVPAKDNKATIDVANLAPGVYVIDCYRGGVKIAAAKFIKN